MKLKSEDKESQNNLIVVKQLAMMQVVHMQEIWTT